MKKISLLLVLFLIVSCNVEGVKKETEKGSTSFGKEKIKEVNALNSDEAELKSTETYSNGIVISWIEHGKGEKVQPKEVYQVDYKVTLKDGQVIDGNHLLKKESLPFMTGFQMQTKGWDFAMEQLNVGDFVRVKIPAELSRGDQEIKGLLPKGAENYLTIKVLSKVQPTKIIEGVKVWLFEENKTNKLKFNDKNSTTFHCIVSSQSHPYYYNSFQIDKPYNLKMSDKGIIPGLKKALKNCKKADRMFVYVPSTQAYGTQGLEGRVAPNEDLFYNILVMDVLPN